jgi:hypothetical protein
MFKIMLKNILYNFVGFFLIMALFRFLTEGSPLWEDTLYFALGLAIVMAIFNAIYLKYELNERGYKQITEEEAEALLNNTFVGRIDKGEVERRISRSHLRFDTKLKLVEEGYVIKRKHLLSNWGDPIYLVKEEGGERYRLKAKRGVFSPDVQYYINALNIRKIRDLLIQE